MRFQEINEAGHEGGSAKLFEDDLVTLAKLSTAPENKGKAVATVYDENKDQFKAAPKTRADAIASIEALNKRFPDEVWTEGYNSNFALQDAPSPAYGTKTAKSDIVLNDKPMSVKLSGAFVVASAQNKDEFSGIFNSALDFYASQKSVDFDISAEVNQLKESIQEASEKYIGEVKQRVQKKERQLKVLSKFQDASDIYNELEKFMDEAEGKMVDHYSAATAELKKGVLKKIQDILKNNPELKQYVTWEALSSSLKYNYQLPYATWVISPSGVYNISTPDAPYVAKCAQLSKFDIRGLPDGAIRSGTTQFAASQKSAFAKGNVDIAGIFDAMNKMAFSMKMDIGSAQAKKLKVDESIDIKALVNKVVTYIKDWFSNIVKTVKDLLSTTDNLAKGDIADWSNAMGIEAEGEIKLA